jgi:hypothetical protein
MPVTGTDADAVQTAAVTIGLANGLAKIETRGNRRVRL